MPAKYTVAVSPASLLLGQDVLATLQCRATEAIGAALTFGHATLVLELSRKANDSEPVLSLPNVSAVQAAGRLIRMQASGGVEELSPGEIREATFWLLPRFPQLLTVGEYSFTYRLEGLGGGECEEAAAFTVKAAPGSIPFLIGLSDGPNAGRAAELLRKFTGLIHATPSEIEQWWRHHGSTLSWTPEGRLARPRIPLSKKQVERLANAPHAGEFTTFDEPPPPFVYEPHPEVTSALIKAIDHGSDAAGLCRFVANYPEPSLVGPLQTLEPVSSPLLDWLSPERVSL